MKLALPFILLITGCSNEDTNLKRSMPIREIRSYDEVNEFIVGQDDEVVFSGNHKDKPSLYKIKDDSIICIVDTGNYVFKPFNFQGSYTGLADDNGNEEFKVLNKNLSLMLDGKSVDNIYTFDNGSFGVVKFKNSMDVYFLDFINKRQIFLFKANKLHSVVFSKKNNFIIASYDSTIIKIDISNSFYISEIGLNISEEKLNLSIQDDEIFFVNNSNSNFYQIYSINLRHNTNARLLLRSDYDLRMPKVNNSQLYFIEIKNSEYLLKSVGLVNKKYKYITKNGVVYNYEFRGKDNLVFTYTNFITPRSLMTYKISSGSIKRLFGSEIDLNLKCNLVKRKNNKSCAFIYSPSKKAVIQGVILNFRPGVHSDFSPRWDLTLMSLCHNGYIIMSPNYPMSTGYGKFFTNKGVRDAVSDIEFWKKYIEKNFNTVPIYFLSSSFGNVIMESYLLQGGNGPRAASTLFGIPNPNYKPSIPTLYILGRNDSRFNYDRESWLKLQKNRNISINAFDSEGHGFQNGKNERSAIETIIHHFTFN